MTLRHCAAAIRHFAAATIVALLLPYVCAGSTFFVNNLIGDDRMNGRSPEIETLADGPFATIGRAIQLSRGGDRIIIANTGLPYVESAVVDRPEANGTERFPLVIEGNGAVLRGLGRLAPQVWRPVGEGVFRYQPLRKAHYVLVVNGRPAEEVGVDDAAERPPALQPLQWCAFRGHVYFRVEPRKLIEDYELEAPALEIGLGLHNARHVVVRNLTIEHFRLDGVHVSGRSQNVRIEHVHSTGNGRAGLVASGAARVEVRGLDLAGNRVAERLELVKGHIVELPLPQPAAPGETERSPANP